MVDKELSESQKIQHIQSIRKLKNKWNAASRKEKLKVLAAMDSSMEYKWILLAFEELKK